MVQVQSSKPRMQRKYRFAAPLHLRQHFLHVHVSKDARQKLGIKARAVQVSKGDTVKVMSGKKKGTSGKVTRVNLRTGKLYIDSYTRKDAKGKEYSVPISASNVYITDLNLSDRVRVGKLRPSQQALQQAQKAAKAGNSEKVSKPEAQAAPKAEQKQEQPATQADKVE